MKEPASGFRLQALGVARCHAVVIALLGVALVSASRVAQAQVPNVAQMSGVPLPATDVPNAAVVVRLVRGDMSNNVVDHPVELHGGPSVLTVRTDQNGRAQFTGLTPGSSVHAVAVVDGHRLESQVFPVPAQGGVRVALVAAGTAASGVVAEAARPAPAGPGAVTLSGQSQFVVELNDDVLEVFYLLQVSNGGRAPVTTEPLVFELPSDAVGAAILEGSTAQARVDGRRLIVTGPFPPGATIAQAAYSLPYGRDSVTIEQTLPATLESLSLVVTKVGTMHVESPQMSNHGEMPSEGRTFLVGSGPAIRAGEALTFTITGLPRRGSWPRWTALALAIVILAAGAWASMSIGGKAAAAAERRRALQERRDRLFADLVRIEQEHRAGGLDDQRRAARRRDLVAQLERIYGELDQGLAA
jgi:hypothetical protein